MTQGDPLSPTIFNVVVDEVVWHWIEEMVESAGIKGGRRPEGRHQNTLLYVDDGIIAPSDPGWLQGTFSTLVRLFSQVSLRTNSRKTFRMVYHPCQAAGTQLKAAYKGQMTGS